MGLKGIEAEKENVEQFKRRLLSGNFRADVKWINVNIFWAFGRRFLSNYASRRKYIGGRVTSRNWVRWGRRCKFHSWNLQSSKYSKVLSFPFNSSDLNYLNIASDFRFLYHHFHFNSIQGFLNVWKKKLWHINDCIVFSLNLRNILIVGKFVSKITKESNINRGMKENVL